MEGKRIEGFTLYPFTSPLFISVLPQKTINPHLIRPSWEMFP